MNASRRQFALGAALLLCSKPKAFAAAASEPRDVADGFAEVAPGRRIVFPQDAGSHPEFRTEWWYLTANLRSVSGADYGVQWTLFRRASEPGSESPGWSNQNLWMGHAAVTSAKEHLFAEDFARGGVGQAGVIADPFHAWIDDWSFASRDGGDSRLMRLTAQGDKFSYALDLVVEGAPALQGEAGFSRKSERGAVSYYYSLPFIRAEGALTIHGQQTKASGSAWMDHEWSSDGFHSGDIAWDWFALHLASGAKVMLFRTRSKDAPDFVAGLWIEASGASHSLAPSDIALTPLQQAEIANRALPVKWRVQVKSAGFDVMTAPVNFASWMGTRFPYWEGPIRFDGTHKGVGYLEMTGY